MEVGVLERLLRELPGVLDCSVTDDSVAIVVHPEVDPRIIELRAKALLADVDATKSLLVVGGMTAGPQSVPPPPAGRSRSRGARNPLSATGVVLLVLALLFVVPITARDASNDREVEPSAPVPLPVAPPGPVEQFASAPRPGEAGAVVGDEAPFVVDPPASDVAPSAAPPEPVGILLAAAVTEEPARAPAFAAMVGEPSVTTFAAARLEDRAQHQAGKADKGADNGKAKAKGKAKGKGKGKSAPGQAHAAKASSGKRGNR